LIVDPEGRGSGGEEGRRRPESTAKKSTAKKSTAKKSTAKKSTAKKSTAKKSTAQAAKLELYRRLLASVPGVKEKTNFGSSYTAVNGNMYSIISKHGVVGLRLPDGDREGFLRKYRTTLFRGDPGWPPAKEYVVVPDRMLRDASSLRPYLELSFRYALSLRPKATRK
jgi:hypothetical protein